MQLIVTCLRPGMWRGGQPNPAAACYTLDHFSEAQLLDLIGDPNISVIVGHPITLAGGVLHLLGRPLVGQVAAHLDAPLVEHPEPGPVVPESGAPSAEAANIHPDAGARAMNPADAPVATLEGQPQPVAVVGDGRSAPLVRTARRGAAH